MCVEIVSLGKVALSTSRTLNPRRARSMAVGEPAHRAPMTMASYTVNLRVDTTRRGNRRHRTDYPKSRSLEIGYFCVRVSDEVVLVGPGRGGGAARHAELVEDVADVTGHGLLADEQYLGDGAIRLAGRDEAQHLCLAFAE